MRYTATYNKSGQATIPAAIIKALGLTPGQKIIFDLPEKEATNTHPVITISRPPTREEYRAEMRRLREEEYRTNPTALANSKKYQGKTANELREIWDNSPEGQKYYKEKYGL